MLKESLFNIISRKDAESFETMSSPELMMPFPVNCTHCGKCAEICMTDAITIDNEWKIDLGKCTFCNDCMDSCDCITSVPAPDYSLTRDGLIFTEKEKPSLEYEVFSKEKVKTFGKSIGIREIDTGSCNACESEINCCSNRYYDMSRFGLKIVASPRHADVLMVTGPMAKNMETAAVRTYDAAPYPKLVVATGTCAISGGLFVKGDVTEGATDSVLKADMYITGCPPSPARIIRSLTTAFRITEQQ